MHFHTRDHFYQLDCSFSNITALHLASMLTTLYCTTDLWTSYDLQGQLSDIQHPAMEGLTGQAVKELTREQLNSFSHHQLAMLPAVLQVLLYFL